MTTEIDEGLWDAWLDGVRVPFVVPKAARVREDAEDRRRARREEVLGDPVETWTEDAHRGGAS